MKSDTYMYVGFFAANIGTAMWYIVYLYERYNILIFLFLFV